MSADVAVILAICCSFHTVNICPRLCISNITSSTLHGETGYTTLMSVMPQMVPVMCQHFVTLFGYVARFPDCISTKTVLFRRVTSVLAFLIFMSQGRPLHHYVSAI